MSEGISTDPESFMTAESLNQVPAKLLRRYLDFLERIKTDPHEAFGDSRNIARTGPLRVGNTVPTENHAGVSGCQRTYL